MSVTLTESGVNRYIGKIVAPFKCCDVELEIFDSSNKLKYYINGSCCQSGIVVKCCCERESCQTDDFLILDSNRNQLANLQKV